ncbi:hypothetical protein HZC20_03540 [Candidatus Peregrinibacteria bacterium]|nr:hypothetical protein [Candidatus Peregrinibacteria bacterium]
MKGKVVVGLFILAGLFFSACSFDLFKKSYDASLVTFYVDDGNVPKSEYSQSKVEIIPNYESRTLDVKYVKKDNSSSDIPGSKGLVGGEFFDRFEKVLDLINNGSFDSSQKENKKDGGKFLIKVKRKTGLTDEHDLTLMKSDENFDFVNGFYLDLVDLFSKNVY